ncbi:MAG: hypothetical protein KF760_22370 [Candidatus Eremiobacteraeota bacterium]|nr:hypothetical protein [Candidatus Eremiobacteraeota bacterium]MCW5866428.1 hypothetical protein [Candidatus Eremiobacteraeota bacterium]
MNEIGRGMSGLSGLAPRKHSKNLVAERAPSESFQSGEIAPGLMKKSHFQPSPAEQPEVSKRGLNTGKTVALMVTTLAAGAGALGLANAHPGPTHAQIQMSQRDAHKAEKNFAYLSEVVTQQGGSLKSDPNSLTGRVFHQQRPVDAAEATRSMADGYTVYLYPNAQSEEGIPINSLEELKQLTGQVRSQVAQAHLKQGLEHLKDGLNQVGQSLQDGLEDLFK